MIPPLTLSNSSLESSVFLPSLGALVSWFIAFSFYFAVMLRAFWSFLPKEDSAAAAHMPGAALPS
jgi:hypothetical protein